ncbi:MAG: sigma-70 family RNA polymerase sigma factor [Lacipirellulaceae bacterium]
MSRSEEQDGSESTDDSRRRLDQSPEELFEDLLSAHQHRVYGYIFAMLRDTADSQDVLQQTAVILWQKFEQFDPDTDFFRWAVTVARYEVLNFTKYRRRSRMYFNQDLMEQLADDLSGQDNDFVETRRAALKQCLQKLPEADRKLIESRYSHGLGSRQMSEILGRSPSSICNSLRRVREALHGCIEHTLLREDSKA